MGHEEAEIVNHRLGRSACLRPKKPKQLRNVVLLDGVAGAGITCVYIYIYIYIYILIKVNNIINMNVQITMKHN